MDNKEVKRAGVEFLRKVKADFNKEACGVGPRLA